VGGSDWDLWLDSRDLIFDPAGNTGLVLPVSLLEQKRKGRHFMTRREGEEVADVSFGGSLFRGLERWS
jgi:hypothetical protein